MANETETKKKEDLESRGVRDTADQIGEQETWMDQVKKLIHQNKLAAFSAVLIVVIILMAVFAPLV